MFKSDIMFVKILANNSQVANRIHCNSTTRFLSIVPVTAFNSPLKLRKSKPATVCIISRLQGFLDLAQISMQNMRIEKCRLSPLVK